MSAAPRTAAPSKPRRRWRRRLVALLMILLALLLIPFLLTDAIVRHYLAASDFARFRPTFDQARLGPKGSLVLTNLRLHEPGGDTLLLHAPQVEVAFRWIDIFYRKVAGVRATGVTVHLRPGSDTPLTLLRLTESPPDSLATPAAAPADPWWIDRALVTGTAIIAPDAPVTTSISHLPFAARLAMDGTRSVPQPYVDVRLGTAVAPDEHAPQVSASLHFVRGQTRIRSLDARHLSLTARGRLARQLGELLRRPPAQTPDAVSLSVDRLHLDGHLVPGDRLEANLRLTDFSATARQGDRVLADLQHAFALVSAEAPLNNAAAIVLDGPTLRATRITVGDQTISGFRGVLSTKAGVLSLKELDSGFAGGDVAGDIQFDLRRSKLRTLTLTMSKLNAHQIATTALPGRLDAEGTFSGPANFATDDAGELTGSATLTADAPGRLMIGDEQIAGLIAKPLADAKPPMAPDNLQEIVTQQLKNYPWQTALVTVKATKGRPELTLDFVRRPLEPGDPGHNVEATIDGRKVRVNYPLQIRNYTLAMPHQTIESFLATLTGLQRLIMDPYTTPPASSPASTTPASAPASAPTAPASRPQ